VLLCPQQISIGRDEADLQVLYNDLNGSFFDLYPEQRDAGTSTLLDLPLFSIRCCNLTAS
jgi:hypothetical protein